MPTLIIRFSSNPRYPQSVMKKYKSTFNKYKARNGVSIPTHHLMPPPSYIRYIQSQIHAWREIQHPDVRVYIIGKKLSLKDVTLDIWVEIRNLLFNILENSVFDLKGGRHGFRYRDLKQFMSGRMNMKQAHVLELCMVGNVLKELNHFSHALDIVHGILELEAGRKSQDQVFAHNLPPVTFMFSTVFKTKATGLY